MSEAKTKTIAFRVTQQDYETLSRLAQYLHQQGQVASPNPHLLSKEYTFAFANIIMKMNGLTQTSDQDNKIFALAKGMADTLNPGQQQGPKLVWLEKRKLPTGNARSKSSKLQLIKKLHLEKSRLGSTFQKLPSGIPSFILQLCGAGILFGVN